MPNPCKTVLHPPLDEKSARARQLEERNVASIAENKDGVYSEDLAGATQQATDIAALGVAATADVTTAVNQNTATNIKMNQLMMEMNQAESDLQEMSDYGKLLE